MSTKPSICVPILITSANNMLDFSKSSTVYAATLTAGLYADIYALATEVQTQMNAALSGFTVAVVTSGATPGLIRISRSSGNFELLWLSGANHATSCGALLGCSLAADRTGAITYDSDYQHKYGWYSPMAVAKDGEYRPEIVGGEEAWSLSGAKLNVIDIGIRHGWDLKFECIVKEKMWARYAVGAYLNQDFETVWAAARGGLTYRPDYTVPNTYYLAWMESPQALDSDVAPRLNTLGYFGLPLKLRLPT